MAITKRRYFKVESSNDDSYNGVKTERDAVLIAESYSEDKDSDAAPNLIDHRSLEDKLQAALGSLPASTMARLAAAYPNTSDGLKAAVQEYLSGPTLSTRRKSAFETSLPSCSQPEADHINSQSHVSDQSETHVSSSTPQDLNVKNDSPTPRPLSHIKDSQMHPPAHPAETNSASDPAKSSSHKTTSINASESSLNDQIDPLAHLYSRMEAASQAFQHSKSSQAWSRFIGSLDTRAWATRPTMGRLEYAQSLELKRLIPKNTTMEKSAIIRLYTIPDDPSRQGREIARLPEDITRILTPLIDLEICEFKVYCIENTARRISTGDEFILQIDVFLKHGAFQTPQDIPNKDDVKLAKRQRTQSMVHGFNFAIESASEATLRLRQQGISKLFDLLDIRPMRNGSELSQDEVVEIDVEEVSSDADGILKDQPIAGPQDVSLDHLKQFYQANNESSLLSGLPYTTSPPVDEFKLDLRPYQKHGLSWMLTREKEIGVLQKLAAQHADSVSTQSMLSIKEREEGIMNPLWRRFEWPKDRSFHREKPLNSQSQNPHFYANMYNGELSIDKPLIRLSLRGGIIADEMGLGKTISALALVTSVPYDPDYEPEVSTGRRRPYASKTTLIILPMSLLSQWKKEFDKANNNPNHRCMIYYGELASTNLTHALCNKSKDIPIVLLTTYGTVLHEFTRLSKQRDASGNLPLSGLYSVDFFRIILDEAHNIRNRSTKAAKSIYELSGERRWALTGTPIINRLDDLYSLIKYLELDPWQSFSYWKTFVTIPFEDRKISQTMDVIKSILEPIFLRRTKNMKGADGKALVELPAKEVIIEEIKLNSREQELYDWFKQRANKSFRDGMQSGELMKQYSQILLHILRLRQICCHVDLVGLAYEMKDDAEENVFGVDGKAAEDIALELNEFKPTKPEGGFKNDTEMRLVMYKLYGGINLCESECAICTQSPIPVGEMVVTTCGHQYCLKCIIEHFDFQEGLKHAVLCPICRDPISRYRLFKLRKRDTMGKEVRFHTQQEEQDPHQNFPFQLYLYDPNRSSSKIQALIGHLRALKDQSPGEKVIVFSQFSSYLDIIHNELVLQGGNDFVVHKFDGRLHMQERERVLEKFDEECESDAVTVLLLSLKAGGVGLNLTTASRAFMMDPWWSPSVEDQAIDRIHRIGQASNVKVVRFIAENSIEIKMLKIQERKKQIGDAVGVAEEERRRRKIEEIQMLFEE